jgi:predicted RNA binding protein YcfA (HicA-like mRNA interferase family)
MGEKFRQFTAKELERLLSRYGFIQISQKGSHRKWRNFETGRRVIVPFHAGRNLPLGTLRNILTTADIPEHEWRG